LLPNRLLGWTALLRLYLDDDTGCSLITAELTVPAFPLGSAAAAVARRLVGKSLAAIQSNIKQRFKVCSLASSRRAFTVPGSLSGRLAKYYSLIFTPVESHLRRERQGCYSTGQALLI
jgi:hypothetical protein